MSVSILRPTRPPTSYDGGFGLVGEAKEVKKGGEGWRDRRQSSYLISHISPLISTTDSHIKLLWDVEYGSGV